MTAPTSLTLAAALRQPHISRDMLRVTPFHSRTAPLVRAQTWRRWAGHQVASAYDPHPDREYAAVRSSAALFDVSPLYKYIVRGKDAARLLDRVVTRDVLRARVPKSVSSRVKTFVPAGIVSARRSGATRIR